MALIFIPVVGIAVALIRRRLLAAAGDPSWSGDAPARLLGWAVGLLAAGRVQWGQAMIGKLDRLEGRARRWRFAVGCVAGAVVMPPWGRAAAALGVLMAVAASAAGLTIYTHVSYQLPTDGWTWVWAGILLLVLVGYLLGGSALLRRPGVAGPGLVGGLLVAAAWLAVGGFTFNRWVNSLWADWWLLFLAPVVVGVGGTVWGGSAAVGRRAARLASVTAALSIYLYGVLAVAVLGAAGHDPSDGWTPAQVVGDNLGTQATFYLVALPLMTATLGWAAAAATARLRFVQPTIAAPPVLATTPGADLALSTALGTLAPESEPQDRPLTTRPPLGDGVPGASLATAMVLCAALAAAGFLIFLALLRQH